MKRNIKKNIVLGLTICTVISAASSAALAAEDTPMLISSQTAAEETLIGTPVITVNSEKVDLSQSKLSHYLYEINGNTMVPLRAVAEKMGYKVDWDGEKQAITIYKTIDEAKKAVSFKAVTPASLPEGYKFDSVSVMGSDFLQVFYKNEDKEILYRVAVGNEDISGDYNIYDKTDTVQTDGVDITIKCNADKCYTAVWNDGASYSLSSRGGIDKDEMIKIAESVGTEESDTDSYENDDTDSLFMNKTEENN